ncbi:carbohydrate-binding protein [Dactylosporangium sp. NPDC005555]|uniref:carbohydrate-binding protein n=1 Tax=Dactylosporangium sp. NPDC005555 TaxID=3154889 RepID=UPI0033BA72A6
MAAILPLAEPAQAAATRYEAESATISGGAVESNHTGFTGTGFVNYDNATGSYVEWTVNAATAGTATIGLRFANGTTTDRPMDVSVNGTAVATSLSFPGTGNWDTWQTKTITAAVNAGTNRIRAVATTVNGGPNVDRRDVDVAPPTSDYQAENATVSQGAVESNHTGFTGTGFVNYDNIVGSYVEWSIPAATAGNVSVAIRYANGVANGASVDRPMDVTVNGTLVRSALSFPSTGNWDTWQTVTLTVGLSAGTNRIRAIATTANGGPNVDRLSTGVPGDTAPPTAPGQPACGTITENSINLSWGASTDNVGVVAYDMAVAPYEYFGWGNPQSPTSVMSATGIKFFTLAFMLSDGGCNPGIKTFVTFGTTPTGPDSDGVDLINKGAAAGLNNDGWTIMPFDFGGHSGTMGAASVSAADGLKNAVKNAYGYSDAVAYTRIGISSMNGKTDETDETVTLADFQTILAYAQQHHLARLTFWSVNRDRACGSGGRWTSPSTARWSPAHCPSPVPATGTPGRPRRSRQR